MLSCKATHKHGHRIARDNFFSRHSGSPIMILWVNTTLFNKLRDSEVGTCLACGNNRHAVCLGVWYVLKRLNVLS